jgi:predicted pyridoxine 5'-phosphate oxidase superfamily flavin-nucleotide-binding protein
MRRVVREQRLGFIATVCPDGTPNLSPKGTTRVWDGDHLVFADFASPRTIENLRQNPSIEINVVDQWLRKGYRFKGSASILEHGDLFEEIMSTFRRELPRNAGNIRRIVLVEVEKAAPLVSPGYDAGMSEQEMFEQWSRYWRELYAPALDA